MSGVSCLVTADCQCGVQDVPDPPIVAVSPSIVQVRPVTASLAVMVRVIVLPVFA